MHAVEPGDAFRQASQLFLDRLAHAGAEQWSSPTPCSEWNVHALVNHVVGEWLWVPDMMAGKTVADVGTKYDGDVLGDDPQTTAIRARGAAVEAFEAAGAMTRTVHLSFGDVPGAEYATQMGVDATIHSWDLASAVAGDTRLPEDVVDFTYRALRDQADQWRAAGGFGPEREPADDTTQAKLLALTGR